MIINRIKRAFLKPNWEIAIRITNKKNGIGENGIGADEYMPITVNGDCWCADPFPISYENKVFIFCECYLNKKRKGTIAVTEYKGGKTNDMKIIIEQDYHMSYPCIFTWNSAFYMIPETCENGTIELYQAKEFPYNWGLITVLKKGVSFVDSTIFEKNNELFLVSYKVDAINKVCVFQLDMDKKRLTDIVELEDDNSGRPAGNIQFIDGVILRPSQNCKNKYGEDIILKKIEMLNNTLYKEQPFSKIEKSSFTIDGVDSIDRIHTYNKTGNIEIIDYSCDTVEIYRPIRLIVSMIKRNLFSRTK